MLRRSFLLSVLLGLAWMVPAAKAADGPARILMVTQSAGFRHGSVTRKEGQLAPAERALTELGISSNLFRVDCTQDCAKDFKKEKLQHYDIVFFYTTGKLPIAEADLDYFFKEWLPAKGHGFIGAHSAADGGAAYTAGRALPPAL